MPDPGHHASPGALAALEQVVREIGVAQAIHSGAETALLQSVVDAAVTLFEAEASSIALFEREPDRLEYRVAAGAQGSGVVGLSVAPSKGVADSSVAPARTRAPTGTGEGKRTFSVP